MVVFLNKNKKYYIDYKNFKINLMKKKNLKFFINYIL